MVPRTPFLLIVAVSLWCLLIVAPPLAAAYQWTREASFVYHFFSLVCHQDPDRSLHILGHPLAVCARCSMIYFGFYIGMISMSFRSRPAFQDFRPWFTLFVLPMVLDVALDAAGLHATTLFTRVVTGLVFGLGSAVLLQPLMKEGLDDLAQPLRKTPYAQTR